MKTLQLFLKLSRWLLSNWMLAVALAFTWKAHHLFTDQAPHWPGEVPAPTQRQMQLVADAVVPGLGATMLSMVGFGWWAAQKWAWASAPIRARLDKAAAKAAECAIRWRRANLDAQRLTLRPPGSEGHP